MADILEFGKKARDVKCVREVDQRQRKIEALRRIFQCTRCLVKCAKCGTQVQEEDKKASRYVGPYVFCNHCREEYEEYRERMEGKEAAARYHWHNEEWMNTWRSWLEHQKSLDVYRQSKEFLQLLREVEEFLGH